VLSDEDMEEIISRLEDSEFEDESSDEMDMDMDMDEPSDEMDMDEPSDEMDIPESEMFEEENDEQWEGTMAGKYDLGFSGKPKKSESKVSMA
jgi:hypothetical protein